MRERERRRFVGEKTLKILWEQASVKCFFNGDHLRNGLVESEREREREKVMLAMCENVENQEQKLKRQRIIKKEWKGERESDSWRLHNIANNFVFSPVQLPVCLCSPPRENAFFPPNFPLSAFSHTKQKKNTKFGPLSLSFYFGFQVQIVLEM